KESKIEVLSSRRYAETLSRPARNKVRAAFIESFRKKNFDEGLSRGIVAIEAELAIARQEGKLPQAEQPEVREEPGQRPLLPQSSASLPSGSPAGSTKPGSPSARPQVNPLVIRNQTRLTLEGARAIIAGSMDQAALMNLKLNIAVVDDGGHLLSFD